MKKSVRRLKNLVSQTHMMKSIVVKDIDAAASIHEYFSELVPSNLRRHHQRQVTWIINPGRVILTAPENRVFRPSQVTGNRQLNGVYCPFMELLIPLP